MSAIGLRFLRRDPNAVDTPPYDRQRLVVLFSRTFNSLRRRAREESRGLETWGHRWSSPSLVRRTGRNEWRVRREPSAIAANTMRTHPVAMVTGRRGPDGGNVDILEEWT